MPQAAPSSGQPRPIHPRRLGPRWPRGHLGFVFNMGRLPRVGRHDGVGGLLVRHQLVVQHREDGAHLPLLTWWVDTLQPSVEGAADWFLHGQRR